MWWIIVGVVLLVMFVCFFMFNHGADVKKTNAYFRQVEDDEQVKAMKKLKQEEITK